LVGWIREFGAFLRRTSTTAGFGLMLIWRTALVLPHALAPRRFRNILDLIFIYAIGALPVTLVVSVFTGMILALNTGLSLKDFGQEQMIGRIVAVSLVREMGPFMTALILAASVGSGVAAEIGTMKISEEIDALEIMSISPIKFLVLPRMVALTLVCPLMTLFAGVVGILGGILVSEFQLGVNWVTFKNDALLHLQKKDVYTGLLKSFIFGLTIATVGCTQGLITRGGATGVGSSTRRSVVVTFLLVIIIGYYVTWMFFS